MSPWRRWRRRKPDANGREAAAARRAAERRRQEQARRWPEVQQARDQLAQWVTDALRGGQA